MSKQAGIWIDKQHATLVLLSDDGTSIERFEITSNAESPGSGEHITPPTYTKNDFVAEDRLERKKLATREKMYAEISHFLRGVDSLFLLGPGEAKIEFRKHLASGSSPSIISEIETSDKLTENQLVAKVRHHFAAQDSNLSAT